MEETDAVPVIIPDYPKEEENFYKLIDNLIKK